MRAHNQRIAIILSSIIVILSFMASIGGLILPGLYRDNEFVKTTWLGNDAITLFIAIPILIASMYFTQKGSLRAHLIWFGVLDYMLYNYAFYLFAARFNWFFLIYAALFALAMLTLIFGLANLDSNKILCSMKSSMPVDWIAGYFLFIAFGISTAYIAQSIGFIITGSLPSIIDVTGHPTNVIFALDLTLLVPWLILGAVWIRKRYVWGYVIAGIINIKGPIYTLVLAVNSILVVNAGLTTSNEFPFWGLLTFLGVLAGILFYKHIKYVGA